MLYTFARRRDTKFYRLLQKGLEKLPAHFYYIDNYEEAEIIFVDRVENLSLVPSKFISKAVVWYKHALALSEADRQRLMGCAVVIRYGFDSNPRFISRNSVFLSPFVDDYADPLVERSDNFLYCKELCTYEKAHLVINLGTFLSEEITFCGEVKSNFQPYMEKVKNYTPPSRNTELVYARHKALIDLNENDNWHTNCLEALQYGCVPFTTNPVPFLSDNFPQLIIPKNLVLLKDKAEYIKDTLVNNKPSEEEMTFVANKHNYSNIVTTLITQCLRTIKTI